MPSNRTWLGPSRVHGIGLFARIPIARGKIVTRYRGEIIDDREFDRRYGDERATYVVDLGRGKYLDASGCDRKNKGRWANDARGTRFRNNAKIVTYPDDKTYLVAIRNIREGEEVLVSYGEDYWL